MNLSHRQVLLRRRPSGRAATSDFAVAEVPRPVPQAGEALVRMLWLAIDVGMVNRLRDEKNYAARVEIGEPMHGTGIGEVVGGSHAALKQGELVRFLSGWQEYALLGAQTPFSKIDAATARPEDHLSYLGDSGLAAYFGIVDVLKAGTGQVLVVSAAAGGVGALAGQLGKLHGCKVIGIAGDESKCRHVVERLGFDACVDHRAADFREQLAAALPGGVDRYFDNVGGAIAEALLPHYNPFGRIAVCGRVGLAHLTDTNDDIGLRDNNTVLVKRLRKQGFLVYDYPHRFAEAIAAMAKWHAEGRLISEIEVHDGIEAAPASLVAVLHGRNIGKQLVRVAAN